MLCRENQAFAPKITLFQPTFDTDGNLMSIFEVQSKYVPANTSVTKFSDKEIDIKSLQRISFIHMLAIKKTVYSKIFCWFLGVH